MNSKHHGVGLALGREATSAAVRQFQPEVVVLATGSLSVPFSLPAGGRAYSLEEALAHPESLGRNVAFYDTIGEWSALGAIEHFSDIGKKVAVFSPVPAFSWRTTIYSTYANSARLKDKQVQINLMRRIVGFGNSALQVEDTSTGEISERTGFDSLIAVQYNQSDDSLYDALRADGFTTHLVGDALSPRTALEAVYEGHEIGMKI